MRYIPVKKIVKHNIINRLLVHIVCTNLRKVHCTLIMEQKMKSTLWQKEKKTNFVFNNLLFYLLFNSDLSLSQWVCTWHKVPSASSYFCWVTSSNVTAWMVASSLCLTVTGTLLIQQMEDSELCPNVTLTLQVSIYGLIFFPFFQMGCYFKH